MRYKQSCFLDGRITVHVKQPVNHTHGRLDRSHKLRFSHHQLYISAIHCHTTTNNAETCNQKVLFYQKKKKNTMDSLPTLLEIDKNLYLALKFKGFFLTNVFLECYTQLMPVGTNPYPKIMRPSQITLLNSIEYYSTK